MTQEEFLELFLKFKSLPCASHELARKRIGIPVPCYYKWAKGSLPRAGSVKMHEKRLKKVYKELLENPPLTKEEQEALVIEEAIDKVRAVYSQSSNYYVIAGLLDVSYFQARKWVKGLTKPKFKEAKRIIRKIEFTKICDLLNKIKC